MFFLPLTFHAEEILSVTCFWIDIPHFFYDVRIGDTALCAVTFLSVAVLLLRSDIDGLGDGGFGLRPSGPLVAGCTQTGTHEFLKSL